MSAPVRVRRLILLRHGQTEYNATSRMQGQLDTDLSDLGRRQALTVSHTVADFDPIAIVSSDLRARTTPRRRSRPGGPAGRDRSAVA